MTELIYFNINGSVGKGGYSKPEFPTIQSFLSHMDYLGVDRSLVWHVEACDVNPAQGNKTLLREIREAKAENRIYPAFVITPSCFFEDGVIDFLKENLKQRAVRAFRIMPDVSRFPIRQIERVLSEIAEYKPAVLWDCKAFNNPEMDFRDIEYLAERFPESNFILTQKMWGGFGAVLDLMWRRENVHIDISWLHMRDTIELLVEHFGAERILYGFGFKSHYGASIAELAHADITTEQKELIAHGNIERMLGMKATKAKLAVADPLLEKKPLWARFRAGEALDDIKIIDAHSHTGPLNLGWFHRDSELDENVKNLVAHMRKNGVDRMITSSGEALYGDCVKGNRRMAEVMASHRDCFSGYLTFNPLYEKELTALLEEFFEDGFFVGFKILAAYWKTPLTDPRFNVVWRYADEHCLPILLHTWDDRYDSPAILKNIVKDYPNAKFLLGHSGGGTTGRLEAEELALENENVYLEFCGSFCTPLPFEQSALKVGFDKVVFGTDSGAHSIAWELGRYLSMPLPDEQLRPALALTMEKVLSARRS